MALITIPNPGLAIIFGLGLVVLIVALIMLLYRFRG